MGYAPEMSWWKPEENEKILARATQHQLIVQLPDLYCEEIMPRIVCSQCQSEMKPLTAGVNVIEYARQEPYKIWNADEYHCPGCQFRVIIGFAQKPLANHYDDNFDETLKRAQAKPETLRHNREWQDRKTT